MTTIRPAKLPEELRTVRALLREYEAELGIDLCFQGFTDIPPYRDNPVPGVPYLELILTARTT